MIAGDEDGASEQPVEFIMIEFFTPTLFESMCFWFTTLVCTVLLLFTPAPPPFIAEEETSLTEGPTFNEDINWSLAIIFVIDGTLLAMLGLVLVGVLDGFPPRSCCRCCWSCCC